jgi:hypothetical protein
MKITLASIVLPGGERMLPSLRCLTRPTSAVLARFVLGWLFLAAAPLSVAATAPGAPTAVTAVGGNMQARVTFTAPVSNGGAAITGYTVTSSPGGFTATGVSSPLTVTGLTNGTSYTFTVKATNSVGTGAASSASPAAVIGDWAKNYGLSGSDAPVYATATDSSGNVYIAGYFGGATLTVGGVTLTKIGTQDTFVAKFNAAGTVAWAKNYGGTGDVYAYGTGIAVDGNGNVYLGGYTQRVFTKGRCGR